MLYDFWHTQNARKPGSLHATFLLAGLRPFQPPKTANGINGHGTEDVSMESSPFPSSAAQPHDTEEDGVRATSIVLVRDTDLDSKHGKLA